MFSSLDAWCRRGAELARSGPPSRDVVRLRAALARYRTALTLEAGGASRPSLGSLGIALGLGLLMGSLAAALP